MRRLPKASSGIGFLILGMSAVAVAHDVGAVYPSRGACESALAQINTEDRKFLVEIGEFETEGEANRWFHQVFHCVPEGDQWMLAFDPEAE